MAGPLPHVVAALDPAGGVAAHWQLLPPQPPRRPLWTFAAELRHPPGVIAGRGLHLVGACGLERAATLARGIGELVERAALQPDGAHRCRGAAYTGVDLVSGSSVALAPEEVDHPLAADLGGAEPTPSGTAAELSADLALRSALLEVLERDAVQVAWSAQLRLPGVEVADAARLAGPAFARLLALARDGGRSIELARIPVAHAGVTCIVAAALPAQSVNAPRPAAGAAFGAKAHPDPAIALLGAVQEALQVTTLLDRCRRMTPPAVVTNDDERAAVWATSEAEAVARRWLAERVAGDPLVTTPASAEPSTAALIDAIARDGGCPVAADLTHRLPAPVRDTGWHVVKVVARGYQGLRLDERRTATWNLARLRGADGRLGLPSRLGPADLPFAFPQPLI